MAKKRISNKEVKHLARERIHCLMQMAVDETRQGHYERSKRYVQLARRISNKTKTEIAKEDLYCKGCLSPLVPGMNCKVRLKAQHQSVHCLTCGKVIRTPYAYKHGD
ncbi:ribonuclease P protein component 4 [Candidatus Methanomassiliicoccus intestinalis]|uniref:ribonuclease P protein component 4 n=1 Tax=Candidatus Methanomassiliicoccus intestinalis TaxID=1406512 RepID=UPI0037DD5621